MSSELSTLEDKGLSAQKVDKKMLAEYIKTFYGAGYLNEEESKQFIEIALLNNLNPLSNISSRQADRSFLLFSKRPHKRLE